MKRNSFLLIIIIFFIIPFTVLARLEDDQLAEAIIHLKPQNSNQEVTAKQLEDFQVNENNGYVDCNYPSIGVDSSGNFIVIWEDDRNENSDIWGQLFNADGYAKGANFKVNDDITTSNHRPAIAVHRSGNFVCVWSGSSDIYAQCYNSDGTALGLNFKVNDDLDCKYNFNPTIAMDISGNFVVVWEDRRNGDYDIYAQCFDATGNAQGANFKVNDESSMNDQEDPAISIDGRGNFVIVWEDFSNENCDIWGQCYNSNGNPIGINFNVNDESDSSRQFLPAIAADNNGNFIVVWRNYLNEDCDIYAKRYNTDSSTQGTEIKVNDDIGSNKYKSNPTIAVDDSGNFVIAWQDGRNTKYDIYAQLFNFHSQKVGTNYRVNNDSEYSTQYVPNVKLFNGFIYYCWRDDRAGTGPAYNIFARVDLFNSPPNIVNLSEPVNNSYLADSSPEFSWTVPEDPDGDQIHFRIEIATDSSFNNYISGSPFESINNTTGFSPVPPVTAGSGECSYTLQNSLSQGIYYWRVSASDGHNYGEVSSWRKFTIDTTAPHIIWYDPKTHVPVHTNIKINIYDGLSGVDSSSVVMMVDSSTVKPVTTGSSNSLMITYDPPIDFEYNKIIHVSIGAKDYAGNVMPTFSWTFITDPKPNTPPESPSLISPEPDTCFNDDTPELTWTVPEDADGDLIHFRIEIATDSSFTNHISGSPFESDNSSVTGFTPQPPLTAGVGECSYILQDSLTDGSYYWRTFAWNRGNYSKSSTYRKFTVDTEPPFTVDHNPFNNATGVSISTNIVVCIIDSTSGISINNIGIKVNGSTVEPSTAGSINNLTLTFNPPTDFDYNQTITVSIDALDNAGNVMSTDSYSFTTISDEIAPQITHSVITTANSGVNQSISAGITDNESIKTAMLYYRTGGSRVYHSASMTNTNGTTYEAVIPANMVTERGVEYFIFVQDNTDNVSTIPEDNPEENPQVIQVINNNFVFSSMTVKKAYRMISIPFDLDNSSPTSVLEDDLNQYDDTKWRLLRYINGTNIEYGQSEFTNFDPGNGFWLITKESVSLDVGKGKSVTTKQNYSITLQPGWNQIGNPFTFTVNWSDVIKNENMENKLVGYYGSLNETSGFDYTQTQLVPWQGYFVNNTSNSIVTLEIPPKEDLLTTTKKTANVLSMYNFQDNEWAIQITARCSNTLDKDNYIGCLDDALDQKDHHDFSQVPHFDKHISLYFPHNDWQNYPDLYTGDFREISLHGQFWDFCVSANNAGDKVLLELKDIKNVKDEWDIILIDKNSHISFDFKENPTYTFSPVTNETVRDFRILVGEQQFIDTNDLGIPKLPTEYELSQNYPNPFNPDTKINYALPTASWINISIYNLLGEKVVTLKDVSQNAGRYTVSWNGINSSGERVSSGVYLLRLQTDKTTMVKKMILAR